MRVPGPPDQAKALERLATQVDRIQHDLDDLASVRTEVASQGRAILDLADGLRRLDAKPKPGPLAPPAVPEWMTVTNPALAVCWISDLDQWTRDVWNRYMRLPVCWPWHPPAVADLLSCRNVWVAATEDGASADALATWHDRWQPGTQKRLSEQYLKACLRAELHDTGAAHKWTADPSVLDDVAVAWTQHHDPSRLPGLTPTTR